MSSCPCSSGMRNLPSNVPSPLSCRAKNVSASAVRASRPSRIASCRSARSRSSAANIRRAACRSRLASVGRPDLVPAPVARATSHSSAAATCQGAASPGACSAAWTITRTCSSRSSPAANASRVAAYLSRNSPAIRSPPAICSRVPPVSRANHASVPVSAVSSATRRRSASADNASRNAAARDSTRASSETADTQSAVVEQLHRRTACASQAHPCLGDKVADVLLDARRSRHPIEQR